MKNFQMLFVLFLTFFTIFSCGGGDSTSPQSQNPFKDGESHLIRVGNLEIDEGRIYISLDTKGEYSMNIPFKLYDKNSITTDIKIVVTDLNGEEKSDMEREDSTKISKDNTEIKIALGKDFLPELEELTPLLMDYQIRWETFTLRGITSLFRISPRIKTKVLGGETIQTGEPSTFRLFVNDMRSGQPLNSSHDTTPLKELKISLYNDETLLSEFTGKTDKFGMATIPITVDQVVDTSLKMIITTETEMGTRSIETTISENNTPKGSKVLLTTDKPIYQPGQIIHIRSLFLNTPDKTPIPNRTATLEISDSKGNKVFKKTAKTSDYGVFSADFKLATLVNIGAYTITFIANETILQEKTVKVEHYVLPKFSIEFKSEKQFYLPGDTLKGEISSQYFYGKPVSNALVHIEAKKTDISETTFKIIDATLTKEGKYNFELTLPSYFTGTLLDQGKASVSLEITVTDSANHTQSIKKSRTVAKSPIIATIVPVAGKILPGVEQQIYLILTDPNGAPIASEVVITSGEESKKVMTDAAGFNEFSITIADSQLITATVIVNGKKYFFSSSARKAATDEFLFLTTDASIYTVGESISINLFTGFDPSTPEPSDLPDRAYLDILLGGQIYLTKTIELSEGSGTLEVTIDENLSGPVEMIAYYLTDEGNIIRASKVIFIRKTSSLAIEFSTDKKEYRPRDKAVVTLTVKDNDGEAVEAALGIAMVDEAVFHVIDFLPGMEQSYFDIENSIMESNYTIYGISYDDICTESEDEERDEVVNKKTEAFFSSNDAFMQHEISLDNYTSIEKDYHRKAREVTARQIQQIFQDYKDNNHPNCLDFNMNDSRIASILEKSENADSWNNTMSGTADEFTELSGRITVISAGPDEMVETEDDILVTTTICIQRDDWGETSDEAVGDTGDTCDTGNTGDTADTADTGSSSVKVREWFPETLYYNPELITDEKGIATINLTMPDSITTWRVTTLANSMGGDLGSSLNSIRVFQDFFVDIDFPVFLTQDDEISLPVGIYNYLPQPQTIKLTADSEAWFSMLGSATVEVTVPANSVSAIYFPIKVLKIGKHTMTIHAEGTLLSDAVKRSVTVLPNGIKQSASDSGILKENKNITLTIPPNAIKDSEELFIKIYPKLISQTIEGLDAILKMPYGCFEQTSSATYPNVLLLNYLAKTDALTPEIDLKARDYVAQGYQRLLTYECTNGGFEWFGEDPAHFVLTAYGLLEFVDMSAVHSVDPDIITRTAKWMVEKQNSDGSFEPSSGGIQEGAINNFTSSLLRTTAYGVWALSRAEKEDSAVAKGVSYIEANCSGDEDAYTIAMSAIAILNGGGNSSAVDTLITKLLELKSTTEDGATYWTQTEKTETYSDGDNATLETTALVGLLLVQDGGYNTTVQEILDWITQQKDSMGTWQTTQGTVLALRFMIESLGGTPTETNATVKVSANGSPEKTIIITPENSDVLRLIDFKENRVAGDNTIDLSFTGSGMMAYQSVASWYIPGEEVAESGPLEIQVTYDKTTLQVNDTVAVTVTVKNISDSGVNVILASIGLPPGFTLVSDKLTAAVTSGEYLQKFETTPRQIILYINHINPLTTATFHYDLIADYPIKGSTGESSVKPYYNPQEKNINTAQTITVSE
ncbi:hypothetical protein KAH37_01245 [bacterium]|nr:hypothetical protein [bacterium]